METGGDKQAYPLSERPAKSRRAGGLYPTDERPVKRQSGWQRGNLSSLFRGMKGYFFRRKSMIDIKFLRENPEVVKENINKEISGS